MSASGMRDASGTKLAVFWGHRANGRIFIPIGVFVPVEDVPLIAGFRTIDQGHIDIWPSMQRQWPELRGLEYDEVPRGRVNWRDEDSAYLILLDRRLMTPAFVADLRQMLGLEEKNVIISGDPHYR
jgi:hypothetical protein